jgi:hypothetical protein
LDDGASDFAIAMQRSGHDGATVTLMSAPGLLSLGA